MIYKFTISLSTIPSQSEQELYGWTEHACKRPSTCERVRYMWTGLPTDIGHSTCERDYSPWQCLKACNTMPFYINLAMPYHIPCDVRQAIPYTMWCQPGHIIYHAMTARPYHTIYHAVLTRPYHTPFHACQTIPYTMPCRQAILHTIHCLPGHSHIPIARPYHIPCDARQAILYHAMPARPYYIAC